MSNDSVIIIIMMFVIIHQSTTILQNNNNDQKRQLQTIIPCGSEYLKETIGISITNNHLYQFLFIDNTIQIIRYDYRKLLENNIDKNDYKLNLIDGQMLANGLKYLIPSNVVEQLMVVIQWKGFDDGGEENKFKLQPIISMAISINNNGKIRIFCLKSLDQTTYYIGDYNQEIYMDRIETFHKKYPDQSSIMSIVSNQNNGIITFSYSKLLYHIKMTKLRENYYGNNGFEWTKLLVVDESVIYLYEIDEYPLEQRKQKTLTKSFQRIFGQYTFTYGFVVDDNNQLYLFANENEKLIKISMKISDKHDEKLNQKYPIELKLYKDFFYCNHKQELTTTTTTTTTLTTTIITNKSISNDDDDDEQKKINLLILIPLLISIPLSIIIIITIICYCNSEYYRKKREKKNKKVPIYFTFRKPRKFAMDSSTSFSISPPPQRRSPPPYSPPRSPKRRSPPQYAPQTSITSTTSSISTGISDLINRFYYK